MLMSKHISGSNYLNKAKIGETKIAELTSREFKDFDFAPDADYSYTSLRKMSRKDIDNLSISQLRIMRNEIFARYGYVFKSADLQEY